MILRTLHVAGIGNPMDVGGDSLSFFFVIEQKRLFINHHIFRDFIRQRLNVLKTDR